MSYTPIAQQRSTFHVVGLPLLTAVLLTALAAGCSVRPRQVFAAETVPAAPDYTQDRYWAALPWMEDAADLTPDGLDDRQAEAAVDVFFLHPTIYTGKRGDKLWNGPVDDPKLTQRVQESAIQYQASLFNGVGRVFAPYYRQAHLSAYFTTDTASAKRAFEIAYNDVRAAFRQYLAQHNNGRPIIIAAHSQGTTHALRLLKEFFDGQPLRQQLVVAYIVGIPVPTDAFVDLQPCRDSTDVGCFAAWRTFRKGYQPKVNPASGIVVTNPLLWTTADTYAPATLNAGGVVRPFEAVLPALVDAQVTGSILWASKPKFSGSWLMRTENYHAGDFNLFYVNVRKNATLRSEMFQRVKSATDPER